MKAKQFFMVMLLLCALTVLGSGGAIYWADSRLKARAASVSDLMAERDIQTDKINRLTAAQNAVKNIDELNTIISSLLPQQKNQENLVADIIYTATKEAGISSNQIASISFGTAPKPDALSGTTQSKEVQGVFVYPFNVELKDIPYDTMLKFFAELERNKRIIQADQVEITPDKSRKDFLSTVSLSLKTFVQP